MENVISVITTAVMYSVSGGVVAQTFLPKCLLTTSGAKERTKCWPAGTGVEEHCSAAGRVPCAGSHLSLPGDADFSVWGGKAGFPGCPPVFLCLLLSRVNMPPSQELLEAQEQAPVNKRQPRRPSLRTPHRWSQQSCI